MTTSVVLGSLIAVLYHLLARAMIDNYLAVEKNFTGQNISRVFSVFENALGSLEITATDWANWDSVYLFARGSNPRGSSPGFAGEASVV
ncbi:MAG: hypothetical protein M5R36_12105 [Deltaproteobacteria bacterium]|nr:hypothetical protein [Deltaproteobacteria bacterium]